MNKIGAKVASTRDVIERLQEYERLHGVGAIIGLTTVCDGDRDIEYKFKIANDSDYNRVFRNDDKHYETTIIEIPSVLDTELFDLSGNKSNGQKIIKIGETYSFGGYDWIAAEQGNGYVVLQSYGIMEGMWPGYRIINFGDEHWYHHNIDGQDISNYSQKTMELYISIKAAEYKSADYGKGLFLVSNEKFGQTSDDLLATENYYAAALKSAAGNCNGMGSNSSCCWLGTVYRKIEALFVDSRGHVFDRGQNEFCVVAPAFNLDLSKIIVDDNQILIKEGDNTPVKYSNAFGSN